jgi:SET domain-containing protein
MIYTSPETYKMVALRDIKANEEITNDYTTFNEYNPVKFNCWCQSKNCKKIIF